MNLQMCRIKVTLDTYGANTMPCNTTFEIVDCPLVDVKP